MCGILWVKRLDNLTAQRQVLKRYSKQAHRGTEGFGYIGVKSNGVTSTLQRTQFEHEIRQKLGASTLTEILFHHRYPTSTPNVPESAHPLLVANHELAYNYYVVHNGVITNDDELREKHLKMGYAYATEIKTQFRTRKGHVYNIETQYNDSEAFAIELARTIEGLQSECMAKGAIAYIAYQVEKTSGKVVAMYFGTNGGHPLTMQWNKQFIVIASEGGKAIEANKGFRLDPATNEVVEVAVKLQPMYTYTSMGYTTGNHLLNKPREFNDSMGMYDSLGSYVNNGRASNTHSDEHKNIAELEEAIADVDDEIIGLSGDIEYALNEGEDDTEYSQDMRNLMTRRDKLQNLYARKANATA